MTRRVLVDFHHSSLLRSLIALLEERLGFEVYRPIGMEWYDEGFWNVYDHPETRAQYLDVGTQPFDGSPPLNNDVAASPEGVYFFDDPGGVGINRACTLRFFKENDFEFVVSSMPNHRDRFDRLRDQFKPDAVRIDQIGNNGWEAEFQAGRNIMASTKPHGLPGNVIWYHQEFDLSVFRPDPPEPTRLVTSLIHNMTADHSAWINFLELEHMMPDHTFRSLGGQCRDGSAVGTREAAKAIMESSTILQLKTAGDGFGHVIYNTYAIGRPVIIRRSHYIDSLATELFVHDTFCDLDTTNVWDAVKWISSLCDNPQHLDEVSALACERFYECVDFDAEAAAIKDWMDAL